MKRERLYIATTLAAAIATVAMAHSRGQVTDGGLPFAAASVDSDSIAMVGDTISRGQIGRDLLTRTLVSEADSDSIYDGFTTDTVEVERVRPKREKTPARIVREKVDLDNPVVFSATDSMVLLGQKNAYMYGNGSVTYGDIELTAAEINMDMSTSNVNAKGVLNDSTGELEYTPIFKENGTEYDSETMHYNFKTQRGYITNVVTQQGEGYLTGGQSKKMENGEYYVKDGFYSTCSNHAHPHFGFQLTKAKVIPGKNVVAGPAYMVLCGLPLPLAVPFGYFPFTRSYSSGVIFPTFGDDYNRGFYLSNGGYYFAINDNIDLALTGELYTKGSWGLTAQSSYSVRYKYSGSFNVSYLKTVTGEKGNPDYATQTNFQFLWNHTQDSKKNPNLTLSASVNFTTSGYSRNNISSYYTSAFTENTKSSTVSMSYKVPNSKWSFSTTASLTQRTSDSTIAVSFPNLNVSMSQIYPFKRKRAVGKDRWYEKIKLSYTGQFQNSLTAKQNVFFQKSLLKDWRNGMKHDMPVSATFSLFKYINVTPSLRLTDRMYSSRVNRDWDPSLNTEVCDTSYGFYNVFDFSATVSLDTKVYGFFKPWKIFGDKIKMIRHVLTPTVSFSGNPDFSSPFFGYYGTYQYYNSNGELQQRKYSRFSNGVYGTASSGTSGTISYSLANNLEMKVKTNDSIGEKKVSLIENFTVSQSYNIAADSLNWSDINTSILLRLTKNFNLNLSAVWDFYTYGLTSSGTPVKINKTRLAAGKGIGRLRSTGTSFSYTFNNNTFKRDNKNKKEKKNSNENDVVPDFEDTSQDMMENDAPDRRRGAMSDEEDNMTFNDNGYMSWTIPWNFSVNYSVNYAYGNFDVQKMEYKGKITQNLSFSGSIQPTQNWNLSFSASYNFDTHKISYMTCNVSRDLHCFTLTGSFIPVGPYKSYNFHVAVKSSMLQDLKYDKRSSYSNGVTWY